ncbi:MAG: hypothetical protein U1E22_02830 [Coriobacteriia bacterium]|nr:hypothetical protein [Coriobacteriia bacterium]
MSTQCPEDAFPGVPMVVGTMGCSVSAAVIVVSVVFFLSALSGLA